MAQEGNALPACRPVPDLYELPIAGRSNPLVVVGPDCRPDRHTPNFVVLLESQDSPTFVLLQGGRIPDADGPIVARRGEAQAIRAERHATAKVGMPVQTEHFPTGRCIP